MVMPLQAEHELHRRRSGRNIGLALVLAAFVALVFGLSIAKIRQGDLMQAFDHRPRATALPAEPGFTGGGPAANPVAAPGTPAAALPNARVPAAPAATPEVKP